VSSVLIVNHEPLTDRMSGPSIRNWELATILAQYHTTTLTAPGPPRRTSDRFAVVPYDQQTLPALVNRHDIVLAIGYLVGVQPSLWMARHLIVDLYDPTLLEALHQNSDSSLAQRNAIVTDVARALTRAIQVGDIFICASERQRDFWTGWMGAAGRINPQIHAADPSLTKLLRVVPFGLPSDPPRATRQVLRGVVPGIGLQDFVVLWGGGMWNWFDPICLIKAAAQVRSRLPELRVVFPSMRSPSPLVPEMSIAQRAIDLANELGLTGSTVFFDTGWVPYEERASLLLEANVGISLHQCDVETRYSFRTRVLDYLWAGLPVITTEGDSMADLVREAGLGLVVPAGDVDALGAALLELANDKDRRRHCAERARMLASRFEWPNVAQPLLDYCADPARAPDLIPDGPRLQQSRSRKPGLRKFVALVARFLPLSMPVR
jgi:glycosyltransferase involved in cell wall biosynthesis